MSEEDPKKGPLAFEKAIAEINGEALRKAFEAFSRDTKVKLYTWQTRQTQDAKAKALSAVADFDAAADKLKEACDDER